jgi:hypothetical protein
MIYKIRAEIMLGLFHVIFFFYVLCGYVSALMQFLGRNQDEFATDTCLAGEWS